MDITEIHFDTIDSTNAFAKREYQTFSPDKITLISSDEQTAGYGRYKRKWISPKGVNLLLTFCFQWKSPFQSLALIASYSIATLLKDLHPKIKWPNDVQLHGKKVAGALCEKTGTWIFLGIGVNVNMDTFQDIDQPATSLKKETGKSHNLLYLKQNLIDLLLQNLTLYQLQGFAPFHTAIENLLAYRKERLSCFDGKTHWQGICEGLGPNGELILKLDNGAMHSFLSGDVSNAKPGLR
jgi:BirA family biotin operon repressor/biotin-[acetyl-CoA-carboxylase] ligase